MKSRGFLRSSRLWLLGVVVPVALTGCAIVKVYRGAAIRTDPANIVVGETTVGEVLSLFGPPSRIQRQAAGEVFIYRFTRSETRSLTIEEPVVTNTDIYSYTVVREDSELLVVMFDREDVVRGVGYRNGAEELDR